jgi:SAM-dependent methyltransferase
LRPDAVSTTRYDDVARLLRGERGTLLDLGCGAGQLTIALADRFERLVGLDISNERIQTATSVLAERYGALRDRVSFQVIGAAEPLPFPDGSFDVVVACAMLEAVPDIFFTLDEIARVCRPGGSLLVTVANVCYLKHVFGMLVGQIPVTWSLSRDIAHWRTDGWDGGALRYFSKRSLDELLRHTGFRPEKWSGDGAGAKWRRWYLNFCGGISVRARRAGSAT